VALCVPGMAEMRADSGRSGGGTGAAPFLVPSQAWVSEL
jgi:hypothetical protein